MRSRYLLGVHAARASYRPVRTVRAMSQPARYPTFSDGEFARRLAAVRAKMDEHDIDALLLYGAGRVPEIRYLSNWPGTRGLSCRPATRRSDPARPALQPRAERAARRDDERRALGGKLAARDAGVGPRDLADPRG